MPRTWVISAALLLLKPAALAHNLMLSAWATPPSRQAEQVEGWGSLPGGLKAEVGSPYCFLCEQPQRLVVPQQVRGQHKLWPLERQVGAGRGGLWTGLYKEHLLQQLNREVH